jgi:hypothetical protein
MKHALKPVVLVFAGVVLLAAAHSHVQDHQVPHPNAAKVSVAKHVAPRPQLSLIPMAVAVPAAEHLIAITLGVTPYSVTIRENEQSSRRPRSPPCKFFRRKATTELHTS